MVNEENVEKAKSMLLHAALLSSTFHNTLKGVPPLTRRALMGARALVERAIVSIIPLLDRGGHVDEKVVVEEAYQIATNQLQLSLALLRLDLPQETSIIASNLRDNPFLGHCLENNFSSNSSQHLVRELESAMPRREAVILRYLISEYLVRRSADLLGLNLTRSVGETIRREIRFPPELKQAGIGILSYFQQIIASKYPDMDVGISIEQRSDRVILTIDTPSGEKERIEQELHKYGLVVIGQTKPEDYLPSPIEVMRLKHRLEMAELETRQVRELLHSERSQYENRIKTLESHTELLRDVLDHDRYLTRKLTDDLAQLALQSSSAVANLVQELSALIQNEPTTEGERKFAQAISEIKTVEPTLIERLEELLLKGAIQGAAGNYLYAWLQILSRLL